MLPDVKFLTVICTLFGSLAVKKQAIQVTPELNVE